MFTALDIGKARGGPSFYFEMWYFGKGNGVYADGIPVEEKVLEKAAERIEKEGMYVCDGLIYGPEAFEQLYSIKSWKLDEAVVSLELMRTETHDIIRDYIPKKVIKVYAKIPEKVNEVGSKLGLPVRSLTEKKEFRWKSVVEQILNS